MLDDNEYGYDIDFEYFNKLTAHEMYGELMWIIDNDGRLIDRKLCYNSINLKQLIHILYVGTIGKTDIKYILFKAANKIALLEKYITKQFSEDYYGSTSPVGVYDDDIYNIEKELLDMIDIEKEYEKRYDYLKEKYGVIK
jgi:hypothetical protein